MNFSTLVYRNSHWLKTGAAAIIALLSSLMINSLVTEPGFEDAGWMAELGAYLSAFGFFVTGILVAMNDGWLSKVVMAISEAFAVLVGLWILSASIAG